MSKTYRKDHYENDKWHEGKSSRDKKKKYKANSIAKTLTKKKERASLKHDFIYHRDDFDDYPTPKIRKHNDYDWN